MTNPTGRAPVRLRWLRALFAAASLVIFLIAARVLYAQFHSLSWSALLGAAGRWRERLLLAIVLCGLSFAMVGLIERRALVWARARAPLGEAFMVSFIANGFAHSLGGAAVIAGAVRARLYARLGVSLTTSAAVTAFQTVTSKCGVAALAGLSCAFGYAGQGGSARGVAMLCLGAVGLYLLACSLSRATLRLGARTFALPTFLEAVIQTALGAIDNALAVGILWVLLPARAIAYPRFFADYVMAYVGGALSGLPGGAGPFEGLLVKLLPDLDRPMLAAALVGFRLIFNIVPLIGAALLFAGRLASDRREAPAEPAPAQAGG